MCVCVCVNKSFFSCIVVIIGFGQTTFLVAEGDLFVDVPVVIINGELSRPVEVTVTATDMSATGNYRTPSYTIYQ